MAGPEVTETHAATPPRAARRWRRFSGGAVLGTLLGLAVGLLLAAGLVALAAPATSTSGEGVWPGRLLLGALAAAVVAGFVATRRRRGAPTPRHWGRVPRLLAWTLVAGWCATAVVGVLVGERPADPGDLRDAVASGSVDVVGYSGGLGPDSRGSASLELHWTRFGIDHVTEVTQVRGRDGGSDPTDRPRVRGDLDDVGDYLTRDGGSVRLEEVASRRGGTTFTSLGWELAGWVLWPLAALWVLTLRVLAVAPEPWRATRWGWFWPVAALPPLAAIAYLLLGGPSRTPSGPAPTAAKGRRLGGGWAFVIVVVVLGLFG